MIVPRKTSVVILITLAELAWLAAFGLLFAYRGKVGELGRIRHEFGVVSNQLAQYEQKMPNVADLQNNLKAVNADRDQLKASLELFQKQLSGVTPQEVARRMATVESLETNLAALRNDHEELLALRNRMSALPLNAEKLLEWYNNATNRLAKMEEAVNLAQSEKTNVLESVRRREIGEFSVRRELTGLPPGVLHRVVFMVDRSSSMTDSPAWNSAKNLVRTWLEFLPVEESAIVFFDDKIASFPHAEYLQVRDPNGKEIPANRKRIIDFFDQVRTGGAATDMLNGLITAYKYPKPDVIVVFTDGHPRVQTRTDASLANAILDEVKKNPGIPILSVAVGSYEVEGLGTPWPKTNAAVSFLKFLAKASGGNFLAR